MTELSVVAGGQAPPRELRLQRAVSALAAAAPSAEALKRKPPKAGWVENLVLEFDEAYTAFVEGFETLPTEDQLLALQAIDQRVSAMVGAKDPGLWTAEAWRAAPDWDEVRALAAQALRLFDWPEV